MEVDFAELREVYRRQLDSRESEVAALLVGGPGEA
jgi:hypothetical protein